MLLRISLLSLPLIVLAGCAGTPNRPAPQAPAASPTNAAVATSVVAPSAAESGTAAVPAAVVPAAPATPAFGATAASSATAPTAGAPASTDAKRAKLKERAESEGYRMVMRSGKPFYCRVDTSVGTHIPESRCLSEQALQNRLDDEMDNRDSYARSRNCGNMTCSGKAPQGH